jgi:beta-glucosidase
LATTIVFPKNFIWGAATASYQIEGAAHEDGRGETIWDKFSHLPGKVVNDDTGDRACDHYHRYREDVKMMKELGLQGYRFSIAWSRILPEGTGKVNSKGMDFYQALVDRLLENGIEPLITLYHWDLPQALEERGGWDNRDIMGYFSDYAAVVFERLGDRVKKWITLNEPWVQSFAGYAYGEHAPGFQDFAMALRVSHNMLLSHAKAVELYRSLNPRDGKIGIALSLSSAEPVSAAPEDQAAAKIADGYLNQWYLDPVFKGIYPDYMINHYREKSVLPLIQPGDMELLARNRVDFLGVNYYFRTVVEPSDQVPVLGYRVIKPRGSEYTHMDWEVYPRGLSNLLVRITRDYQSPHLSVTENGVAFKDDRISNGRVEDDDRVNFLRGHFTEAFHALEEGAKLDGYYVWSLLDNFEWAQGYNKRFGIIRVDYQTFERTWKKSAHWYREVIKQNGF